MNDNRTTEIQSAQKVFGSNQEVQVDRCLLVIQGEEVRSHALPPIGVLSIGRKNDSDIPIQDSKISRRHALLLAGPEIFLEDCGSTNGIYLNGRRLQTNERVRLGPGDIAEMGGAMLLLKARSAQGTPPVEGLRSVSSEDSPVGDCEDELVMVDESMLRLRRLIERIAPSAITILIQGETGVGKDVIARLIHHCSRRPAERFIGINCAALPETLLESELFGHEKGAFTGAFNAKPGLLEAVQDGTILLDEIADMSLPLQAKMLRTLEEQQATRIGGIKPYRIQARFIATTNRNLAAAVEKGLFRQDLFFRLDGITLFVPPLRERIADIEPLARHFLGKFFAEGGRPEKWQLDPDALEWLRNHQWIGNVRELKKLMERVALLSPDGRIRLALVSDGKPAPRTLSGSPPTPPASLLSSQIGLQEDPLSDGSTLVEDRPAGGQSGGNNAESGFKAELKALEHRRILEALKRTDGNQSKAARLLGVSRRTLINRIEEYGISRPRKK